MHDLEPLVDINAYHNDTGSALSAYYTKSAAGYPGRFVTYTEAEVSEELLQRLDETELRSTLIVLARVEAAFRRDFLARVNGKKPDAISRAFRQLHAAKREHVRLPEDILEVWKANIDPADRTYISKFKGMLHTRHWLAHGRYWVYAVTESYLDVYLLADALLMQLTLVK